MRRFLLIFCLALLLVACDGGGASDSIDYLDKPVVEADTSSEETCVEGKCFVTDRRDGQSYRIVTIGDQVWMAENLNLEIKNSSCKDNSQDSCAKYGRWYLWGAAMDSIGEFSTNGLGCGYGLICSPDYPVRGVCPAGWHLPSRPELQTLMDVLADLRLRNKQEEDSVSEDFEIFASPFFTHSAFWGSTDEDVADVPQMEVETYSRVGASRYPKNMVHSVRCIKGKSAEQNMDKWLSFSNMSHSSSSSLLSNSSSSEEQKISYGQMIDERDGQIYRTVIIRNQIWMAENLNYAYLQPTEEQDSSSWCQRNDPENCKKYGRLYLWSAAMDSAALLSEKSRDCGNYEKKEGWVRCSFTENVRGACPEGWHLPISSDYALFPVLYDSPLGEFENDELWIDDGTALMTLNILPAGYYTGMTFFNLGMSAWFWTVSDDSEDRAECLVMMGGYVYMSSCPKYMGYSVRCIKDSD